MLLSWLETRCCKIQFSKFKQIVFNDLSLILYKQSLPGIIYHFICLSSAGQLQKKQVFLSGILTSSFFPSFAPSNLQFWFSSGFHWKNYLLFAVLVRVELLKRSIFFWGILVAVVLRLMFCKQTQIFSLFEVIFPPFFKHNNLGFVALVAMEM